MLVGSLTLLVFDFQQQTSENSSKSNMFKLAKIENPFQSVFFAALLGMFIAVPSAINQLNEIE